MAKLIFIGEKFGGRIYELAAAKTTVGRGDHNTLAVHDASVSQTHCEILVYGPEVIVRDLRSCNGTFVQGERLHQQQRQLKEGQIVKFGSVEARLELGLPSADDTATAETAVFSHVRHMRQQPHELKTPVARSVTLDSGSAADHADHTVVLPRPPEVREAPAPTGSAKARDGGKPRNRIAIAMVLWVLVIGLTVILWLILGRR